MKGVSDELRSKVRNKNYKELLFMVFIAHVVSVERCGFNNGTMWFKLHVVSVKRSNTE